MSDISKRTTDLSPAQERALEAQLLHKSVVANPEPSSTLPLLTVAEGLTLLGEWNDAQADYSQDVCIHQMFEEQVRGQASDIAVVVADSQLTYRELNVRANQLAHHLQTLGVGPEVIVGICMERSLEMVVGLFGILKAGGAYVFLDPAYPKERLNFMLEETQVPVLLTQQRLFEGLLDHGTRVVYVDTDWETIAQESEENPTSAVTAHNLAYVMYTSGSTGRPKGVTITHANVQHYVHSINAGLQVNADDVYLHTASFAFSSSVRQLMVPLSQGAKVVIATYEQTRDPLKIFDVIQKYSVTVCDTVRSFWQYGLEALEGLDQASRIALLKSNLRLIVFSGGLLTWEIPKAILLQFEHRPRIVNIYGQTETIGASIYPLPTEFEEVGTVPTGRPIANTQIYILNSQLEPVPIGVSGEVYVGGAGLARGYLNRSELTAETFIANPFSDNPGDRIYKTGDLAHYLPDGNIELLGRIDDQVKIRGMRVELGEIESLLGQHPAVQTTVVVGREDGNGDTCLVAYIVPHRRYAPTIEGRSRYKLPNGMAIVHQNKNETDYLYYEIFEIETYLQHGITLPDNACVFDVGANIGMFTLFVSQRCPSARVYSFEPLKPIFETLRINAELYGSNVKVFQAGMSNEEKTETFTYYPRHSMMSGISAYAKPDYEMEVVKTFMRNQQQGGIAEAASLLEQADEILAGRYEGESYKCHLRRLSDVIRSEGVERIDLLKVDVQRAELDVLRGIESEDWAKIQQIVMEVHDVEGQENSGRVGEIIALLESRGFRTSVEQDELLKGTDRYNLYAIRCNNEPQAADEIKSSYLDHLPVEISPTGLSSDLRRFLKEYLPDYMMPSAFVILEALPLTPNGKLDRRALPNPEEHRPKLQAAYVDPKTEVEQTIAAVWQQVLHVKQVGIHDNFFDIGGHSLLLVQVHNKLRDVLDKDISIIQLFQHPTISSLAQFLNSQENDQPSFQKITNRVKKQKEVINRQKRLNKGKEQ